MFWGCGVVQDMLLVDGLADCCSCGSGVGVGGKVGVGVDGWQEGETEGFVAAMNEFGRQPCLFDVDGYSEAFAPLGESVEAHSVLCFEFYGYYCAIGVGGLCEEAFLPFEVLDSFFSFTAYESGGEYDDVFVALEGLSDSGDSLASLFAVFIDGCKYVLQGSYVH